MGHGFQVNLAGSEAYERFLVPRFFTPCAEQLLEHSPAQAGDRIVDVACGTGVVMRLAARRLGVGGVAIGVDVNGSMIELARQLGADLPCSTVFHQADATGLPLPDRTADVVYCQQGLQFITDPSAALREMHRVLRPGGRLAIALWRSLHHNEVFAALVAALDRHAGVDAAATMRAPFAGPEAPAMRSLRPRPGSTGRLFGLVRFQRVSRRSAAF